MTPDVLTPQSMVALFDELSDHLATQDVHGTLFVVGGAAMALAYEPGRVTLDVDALFAPYHAIQEAAQIIAARHGLTPDWLSDAVRVFDIGVDPQARQVYGSEHLSVTVPSPQRLLAMKIRSGRLTRDMHDIRVLSGLLGLRSVEDVVVVAEQQVPMFVLSERQRRLIEVALAGPG
jgi:hypothetical protein